MLRLFVIGLFVFNVMIVGWKFTQPPQPEAPKPAQPQVSPRDEVDSVPRIALLSELSSIIRAPAMPDDSGRQCFTLGPFPSPGDFRVIESRLRDSASAISMRETEAVVERGYWVYIAPEEDPERLAVSLAVLSAGGASEFAVIEYGQDANAISMGLYSGLEYAELRKQKLEDMGLPFNFEIAPKREQELQYWMDYESLPGQNPSLGDLVQSAEGLSRVRLACNELIWRAEDSIARPLDSPLALPLEEMQLQSTVSDSGDVESGDTD